MLPIFVVEIVPRRGAEMVGGKSSSALFLTAEARSTDAPFKYLLWWVPLHDFLTHYSFVSIRWVVTKRVSPRIQLPEKM